MSNPNIYIPGLKQQVKDRKKRFEELNEFVRSRNGFLTSVPGDVNVTMETLPGSTLPEELRKLGYDLNETGEGEHLGDRDHRAARHWR
jgi:hypothetical protein